MWGPKMDLRLVLLILVFAKSQDAVVISAEDHYTRYFWPFNRWILQIVKRLKIGFWEAIIWDINSFDFYMASINFITGCSWQRWPLWNMDGKFEQAVFHNPAQLHHYCDHHTDCGNMRVYPRQFWDQWGMGNRYIYIWQSWGYLTRPCIMAPPTKQQIGNSLHIVKHIHIQKSLHSRGYTP